MRTWGGYKQQRKCVREYGDSLCCTGTVKPANALHLSPLPSAALGDVVSVAEAAKHRNPAQTNSYWGNLHGFTQECVSSSTGKVSAGNFPIDQLSVLGFGTV